MNEKFKLLVKSREGILYQGEVESMTSFNEKGEFDILSRHANFISLIRKKLIIRDAQGQQIEIPVHNALLRVKGNSVEVYLGIEGLRSKTESAQ